MNPAAEHVLIVGCGDLGAYLASLLLLDHFKVTGLSRSLKSIDGAQMLLGDVTQPETLLQLEMLNPTIIIYCVAADGQTDCQYQASYVQGLKNVLATQTLNTQLKMVMFVSSTRVYGQVTQALLNEEMPAMASDFGGERLLEAERVLETLSCSTVVLRLSGIYGPGRLRMINLAQALDRWPQINSWSNRIHRDDAANFMLHLLRMHLAKKAIKSCYIVTDSKPTSQYQVLNWLADKLTIHAAKPIMPIEGGKRLSNEAMCATGFLLTYPDYEAGYLSLLNQLNVQL